MNSRIRRLGMDRAISRRDFLNGVGVAIGASLLPACSRTGEPMIEGASAYYAPAETGMRGSHPGSSLGVFDGTQLRTPQLHQLDPSVSFVSEWFGRFK